MSPFADCRFLLLSVWLDGAGRPRDNIEQFQADLINQRWFIDCHDRLLAAPGGIGACHLLLRLRPCKPDPIAVVAKPFVLKVWLKDGQPRDNCADLLGELSNQWQMESSDLLLADPALGLCYVLYRLEANRKPPERSCRPFVLKAWLHGDRPYSNVDELSGLMADGWVVRATETVLASAAAGLTYTMFKLERPLA
jgi:hypothetical protein